MSTTQGNPTTTNFLTMNEPDQHDKPPRAMFSRSYRACLNCKTRKIRCDMRNELGSVKLPCLRCVREGRECTLPQFHRRSANRRSTKTDSVDNTSTEETKVRSSTGSVSPYAPRASDRKSREGLLGSSDQDKYPAVHNSSDALHFLLDVARKRCGPNPSSSRGSLMDVVDIPSNEARKICDIDFVGKAGILSESEVYLHPFYPFIPTKFHTTQALLEMPLLLGIVCLISTRHSCLAPLPLAETDPTVPRNIYVHNWLWDYIQTMFSRTVWTEFSPLSIGTIFGFLLVSEWNPRAIHTHATDYANDSKNSSLEQEADRPDLGAFSAAQRSDGMCWMTIGNALRLAENLNLLETHPQVFLAIHLSEITLAIRLGRRSSVSQFLCNNDAGSFQKLCQRLELSREHMAMLEILKLSAMSHDTLYRPRASANVHSGQEGSSLFFNLLDLFANSLDSLRISYPEYLSDKSLEEAKIRIARSSPGEIPTSDMEIISLAFEYFYTCLYIYSLSLTSTDPKHSRSRVLRSMDILYKSKYGELAVGAALEIIEIARAMASAKSLHHAPVRWMVRIVHAIVFLVKNILLSADMRMEAREPSIRAIECASDLLKSMAIDELHLSARYARTTALLCSQIREKLTKHNSSRYRARKKPHHEERKVLEVEQPPDEQQDPGVVTDNATKAGNLASFFTDLDVDIGSQSFEGLAFADTFLDEVEHFFKAEN